MFGKAIVAVALAATAFAQGVTVDSIAALIQCQPARVSWSGGKAPYFLAAIPGNQPGAASIKDFGQQAGTSLTWTVDLPAGTSVTIKITDSDGDVNYNSAVTVQEGSDSCLNGGDAAVSGGAVSGAAASEAAPVSAAASSAAGAVSAASSAAVSATAAASSAASSAAAAVSSARVSAAGAGSSMVSSARPAASSASSAGAAAASPTGAASPAAIIDLRTGLIGAVVGVAGLLL